MPPDPRALVAALCRAGREAGTPAAAAARDAVAAHLVALGYRVERRPFTCTAAALRALPVFAAGLGWLTLLLLLLLVLDVFPLAPLLLWLGGLASLALVAIGIGTGWTTLGEPAREDANLVARRGDAPVRRWLVAHLDTKAQGHSMAGRLVAVWATALAIALLTTAAAWRLAGPVPMALLAAAAAAGMAATLLLRRARLRGESPGARDNGSGLLAVLRAAADAPPGTGVLVTGAEEFGLLGSRILAQQAPDLLRGTTVVNVDTVDDAGPLHLLVHDAPGQAVAARLGPGLAALGAPVRVRRLPAGILVDSLPLARAGAAALTIARADWGTFRRVHTPRDTTDGFAFETAGRLGALLAALIDQGDPPA